MKAWLKKILFTAVGAALAWSLAPLFLPRPSDGPAWTTARVERGDVVRTVTATGTLRALNTVEVGSQVSGAVAALHADHNDAVRAGELLAEIEPSTYAARVAQAEGDLLSAEATLELRRVQARRAAELFRQRLLSQAEQDEAVAALSQQEAAAAKARASLESARVELARTKIHSPIAGVVVDRAVDAGQVVQASFATPRFFTIAQDLRRMEIIANVSEADIGGVELGQAAGFTVDTFPDRVFTGVVRQVRNNPSMSQNVVNYPTIITVENADLRLRPGMTAYVTITTERREGVLRVPNAALRFAPEGAEGLRPAGRTAVFLAAAETEAPAGRERAGGAVSWVVAPVEAGVSDDTHTEILSGVAEGRSVLTGVAEAGTASDGRNPFLPPPPPGAVRR